MNRHNFDQHDHPNHTQHNQQHPNHYQGGHQSNTQQHRGSAIRLIAGAAGTLAGAGMVGVGLAGHYGTHKLSKGAAKILGSHVATQVLSVAPKIAHTASAITTGTGVLLGSLGVDAIRRNGR